MTDVGIYEILHLRHVCDVEKVAIYAKFIAIFAVLLLNLLFYAALSQNVMCKKIEPKNTFVEKK